MRLILVLEHQETVLTVHQILVITIKVKIFMLKCHLQVAIVKKIIIWYNFHFYGAISLICLPNF